MLGSFQAGHRFADQRHRWDELARTAAWSAVVAEFDDDLPADPLASPARCQLPERSALRREWTVVTLTESRAALVSAWEVPTAAGVRSRSTSRSSAATGRPRSRRPASCSARHGRREPSRRTASTTLLDAPSRPDTGAADADRLWLRALARLDQVR